MSDPEKKQWWSGLRWVEWRWRERHGFHMYLWQDKEDLVEWNKKDSCLQPRIMIHWVGDHTIYRVDERSGGGRGTDLGNNQIKLATFSLCSSVMILFPALPLPHLWLWCVGMQDLSSLFRDQPMPSVEGSLKIKLLFHQGIPLKSTVPFKTLNLNCLWDNQAQLLYPNMGINKYNFIF